MTQKIYTDKPASIESEDQFQRYEFSKRIATIVSSPAEDKSLVIGLYGKWGEGKTSVMNFIRAELPRETVIINFNPWLFSDEQHLLKSFFDSLAAGLKTSTKNSKEKFGDFLSEYASGIGSLTQFAGVSMDGAKSIGEKLKAVSIETLKSRIDKFITESKKNIVVFIDDIDRLDVNEIQYVFKLVKLVGDFPRTSYVLSFDDEMVSAALGPKYAGRNETAGYSFLEKIIQMPILIPKASTRALRTFTLNLLTEVIQKTNLDLTENELAEYIDVFDTSFIQLIDNPRVGIRYANALSFSIPLLKNEVNHGNLMLIEGLKIFYPELYGYVRNNKRLFLGLDSVKDKKLEGETIKQIINEIIAPYQISKRNGAIEFLVKMFPQMYAVFKPNSFSPLLNQHEAWLIDKRICSGKYFDRYFSYVVDEKEIPDTIFEKFLEDSKTDNEKELSVKTKNLIDQYSAFDFIQMIRVREETLSEKQMKSLGYAISSIGNHFPKEQDLFIATSFVQSIRMLTRFIRKIPSEDRLTFTVGLLTEAESIEYSSEMCYWLTTPDKNQDPPLIFDEKQLEVIKSTVVKLFKEQMSYDNFFTLIPNGYQSRLLKWWKTSKKEEKSLMTFLNKHITDAQFSLNFLKMVTPTVTSFSTDSYKPYTFKTGFTKAEYDLLDQLINVEKLNKALIPMFGMSPYKDDISLITKDNHVNLDDKTLVSVFQWYLTNK